MSSNMQQMGSQVRAKVQDIRTRAKTVLGDRAILGQGLNLQGLQLGKGQVREKIMGLRGGSSQGPLMQLFEGLKIGQGGLLKRRGMRTQTNPQEEVSIIDNKPQPAPKTTDMVRIITN